MKRNNLKKVAWIGLLLTVVSAGSMKISHAGQNGGALTDGTETKIKGPLPSVGSSPFDEGTETSLTPQQMESIRAWAVNSKASLQGLLDQISTLSYRRSKEVLMAGIRDTVLGSAPKSTELLLRYILNRAMKVVDQIDRSADNSRPGVIDQEVRVLKRSVEMALEYYDNDIAFLNSHGADRALNLPFAKFGQQYAEFLMEVNESLLNSKASYAIAVEALGFLQVDLYKDQNRDAYGLVINKLYRFLQTHPDPMVHPELAPATSLEAVNKMREVRKAYYETVRDLSEITFRSVR